MKLANLKIYFVLIFLLSMIALICATKEGSAATRCCSDSICWRTGNSYCNLGVLAFGTINPSSTGSITATITTNQYFSCGTNANYTVTQNPATLTMTGPTGGSITYTVGYLNNVSCSGTTETLFSTIGSTILQADYQDEPAGSYTNSEIVSFYVYDSGDGSSKTMYLAVGDVTATITDTCGSPTNGTMSFTIDPSSSGSLTKSTTDSGTSPSVKCTKNASHSMSCSALHGNLSIGNNGTTDPIAYTITTCGSSVTGNGFSTATSIPIGITIPQVAYQDAQAGNHTDTITVTINY